MISLEEIKERLAELSKELKIEGYLPQRYIDLRERKYFWKIKSPPPLSDHEYKELNSEEEGYRLLYEILVRQGLIRKS